MEFLKRKRDLTMTRFSSKNNFISLETKNIHTKAGHRENYTSVNGYNRFMQTAQTVALPGTLPVIFNHLLVLQP